MRCENPRFREFFKMGNLIFHIIASLEERHEGMSKGAENYVSILWLEIPLKGKEMGTRSLVIDEDKNQPRESSGPIHLRVEILARNSRRKMREAFDGGSFKMRWLGMEFKVMAPFGNMFWGAGT
ncbi:hypothetical protein Patl1_04822 [Pistacia atlantica]|uniref:Uncharacterized protein n=1 Tax=Pistacia atlantica TaxID=434234 RepID=A0ACC1BUI6_9ROSI|nr:hypothetical protein Patl1_04822 [Pistacia atlantica]